MKTTDLKSIWFETTSRYNNQLSQSFWDEIEIAHSHKKRYYHNLSHLEHLISMTLEHQEDIEDIEALLFAIFYHDIVYSITRKDNEVKSADLAQNRLVQLEVPVDIISKCRRHIVATKDHIKQEDQDTNYLLDFDLAILGASPEIYKSYAINTRKEYAIYPDFLYNKGRKKVLQHFLKMDNIFKTDMLINQYESTARRNIQAELCDL